MSSTFLSTLSKTQKARKRLKKKNVCLKRERNQIKLVTATWVFTDGDRVPKYFSIKFPAFIIEVHRLRLGLSRRETGILKVRKFPYSGLI
jgi:hypothetical protein